MGMIGVDKIGEIRRAYFEQGRSIKEIVRTLSVSRATVRKVVRGRQTGFKYLRDVQPTPKFGEWVEPLIEILGIESRLPKRERRSTQRLYEELRGRGYDGAHDSVHRFVKSWREERARVPVHAYVPMSFAPGEAYSSTSSNKRRPPAVRADWRKTCCAMAHSSSTNWDIRRSASPAGNCCSISSASSTKTPRCRSRPISPSPTGRKCSASQDDDRHARQADAPLRHRRNRQYELAVQKPLLNLPPFATGARPAPRRRAGKFFRAQPDCRGPVFSAYSHREGGRYWTRKGVAFRRDLTF